MPIKRQIVHTYLPKAFPNTSAFRLLAVLIGLIGMIILPANECRALTPDEILVIANRNVQESVPLALFYMQKRGIPYQNLVVISVTDKERCDREEYEKKVALPIRIFLHQNDPQRVNYHCILTMYGVPLTIDDAGLSIKEKF